MKQLQAESNARKIRTVAHSRVEQVHIVLPMDVNASFQLFGGQLMQWVDIVAAAVARRHSGYQVATAAVDHLEFLAPANLNDMVVIQGRMTYAGTTSMEVCVETFVEQLGNEDVRKLVNRAYLTLVALDQQKKPAEVPVLLPETEAEKADYANGQRKWEKRKRAKRNI